MNLKSCLDELRIKGHTVIPDVLPPAFAEEVKARTWALANRTEARGIPTRDIPVDPNDRSIRLANLIDGDEVFRDLILHPVALEVIRSLIGDEFLISNFSANIALPGARSMKMHSDLALVFPEPWLIPMSLNIGWCLDDVSEANGSTRVLSGSHLYKTRAELPADALDLMVSVKAKKGSIVVMDGRLWHTSGNNVSDGERGMLFGYYSADFLRQQQNWAVTLSSETKKSLSQDLRGRLGITPRGNARLADYLNFPREKDAMVEDA